MKGKKLLSLVLAILLCLPVTAYAQGNGKSGSSNGKGQQTVQTDKSKGQLTEQDEDDNVKGQSDVKGGDVKAGKDDDKVNEHKQEAMQKQEEKKQQIEAFKNQMRERHENMNTLRQQTNALKQEVQRKRQQLSLIVSQIISGEKTLTQDMLDQLLVIVQNLGKDTQEVAATAQVSGDVSSTQTEVNNGNFNNALTSMDRVMLKLQTRLQALTQLSADLDKALAIANLAAPPAQDTGITPTEPSSTGDETAVTQPSSGDETSGTTVETTTGDTQQTTAADETAGTDDQTSATTAETQPTETAAQQ